VPREPTATDAVVDISVDRLSVEAIRQKFKAGGYGKVKGEWIKGWLELR
jgi:hypothetical protein